MKASPDLSPELLLIPRRSALPAALRAVRNQFRLRQARKIDLNIDLGRNEKRFVPTVWHVISAPRVFGRTLRGGLTGHLYEVPASESAIVYAKPLRPAALWKKPVPLLVGAAWFGAFEACAMPMRSFVFNTLQVPELAQAAIMVSGATALAAVVGGAAAGRTPYSATGVRFTSRTRRKMRRDKSLADTLEIRGVSVETDFDAAVALRAVRTSAMRGALNVLAEARSDDDVRIFSASEFKKISQPQKRSHYWMYSLRADARGGHEQEPPQTGEPVAPDPS